MQPVSIALLRFQRLKKLVILGSAIVLLMPPNTANATATFYGSLDTHFSLLDIVQVNTSAQATDSRSNPSDANPATASLLRTASSIAELMVGASTVETLYVSSVSTDTGSKSSSASLRHLGVTSGDATAAPGAIPQDLYCSLLDETVTITASNNIANASTDTYNQLTSNFLDVLASPPASGLSRIVEAGRQSAAIDGYLDSTLDESSRQGWDAFGGSDVRIESRVFEDAVRPTHKSDSRQLIQLN